MLFYDEKPGIQAIVTISEDHLLDKDHCTISRDYEYKRLGTLLLLAGIDLQTGEAIPLVSETHNSITDVTTLTVIRIDFFNPSDLDFPFIFLFLQI